MQFDLQFGGFHLSVRIQSRDKIGVGRLPSKPWRYAMVAFLVYQVLFVVVWLTDPALLSQFAS